MCADGESFYLSLYVLYHTHESFVILKIKDDKPFIYCKDVGQICHKNQSSPILFHDTKIAVKGDISEEYVSCQSTNNSGIYKDKLSGISGSY